MLVAFIQYVSQKVNIKGSVSRVLSHNVRTLNVSLPKVLLGGVYFILRMVSWARAVCFSVCFTLVLFASLYPGIPIPNLVGGGRRR